MSACYKGSEKCPSCGNKGGLISSIAQKETYTTKSKGSISGLGVSLSSEGLGLMPVIGGISKTETTKSKRAELFTEPDEPVSAWLNFHIVLILCVLAALSAQFLFHEDFFSLSPNLFSNDLLSILAAFSPLLIIATIVYKLCFTDDIQRQDDFIMKKHKKSLRRYNNTRICERCDLLFNNELKKTSNITEEGLNYMIYSGANPSIIKKGACK